MIDNKLISELIPFSIHDGSISNVKWINNDLYLKISIYDHTSSEQSVQLCFHGVTWIRSLCTEDYDGYIENTPFEDYPLISQDELNEDYVEFVCYGLLDDICIAKDGIIFINDIFFFPASSMNATD